MSEDMQADAVPWTALRVYRRSSAVGLLSFVVLHIGCAPSRPLLPRPEAELVAAEKQLQYEEAAELLIEHHKRLLRVGSRLLVANDPFCDRHDPFLGMIAVSRSDLRDALRGHQYWTSLRDAIIRRYEIGDSVKVLYVLPESPAARAGILPGDVIRSHLPSELDSNLAIDGAATQRLRFQIGRNGDLGMVEVEYVPQCAYSFRRILSDEIRARSEGRRIEVTTGMLRFAADDDDLATVLSHELAHHVLAYLAESGATRTRGTRLRDEREADHVGVYLAARAGYDISGTVAFWRRWARTNPEMISDRWSRIHPNSAERVVRLRLSVAEVQEKLRTGQPLLPYGIREPEFFERQPSSPSG